MGAVRHPETAGIQQSLGIDKTGLSDNPVCHCLTSESKMHCRCQAGPVEMTLFGLLCQCVLA